MRSYLLVARRGFGLGDAVLVTALARDIKRLHPDCDLAVDTNFRPVWDNNPHVVVQSARRPTPGRTPVRVDYSAAIRASRRGSQEHFLKGFHDNFTHQTGLPVWPTRPSGDLHLTAREREPPLTGRYWVILAGGKSDMTVKIWNRRYYQAAVDALRDLGVHCVQAGARERSHLHEPLAGCLDLVGRTPSLRDLFSLVAGADGVVCGITSGMHLAACFDKPCVVIAGGREEPSFVAYSNAYAQAFGPRCPPVAVEHKFLHTVGLLPCCAEVGCWKKRVVPLDFRDGTPKGRSRLCLDVVDTGQQALPRCLQLIEPAHVVAAVTAYYEEGVIPPIQPSAAPPVPLRAAPAQPAAPPALQQPAAPATLHRAAPELHSPVNHPVFDHPTIGGKFTVFVLCYGDHEALARRCVDSILHSVPIDRVDLRVACNAVSPGTLRYLENQPLSQLYVFAENRFKYPVMREVFRDERAPIKTNYLVWFDDDSYVADPKWLEKLGQAVVDNHPHGSRLFGWKHFHDLRLYLRGKHEPRDWFKAAPWHRGRMLRVRNTQRRAPNGTCIDFVVGSFWALATALVAEADIPDGRLVHNGGDCCIGEQVNQAGYLIHNFNQGKKIVLCSMAPRRGYEEKFPWSNIRGSKQLP